MDQMVDLHGDAFKDHKNWESGAPHKAARLPKMISTLSNHVENLNWTRVKGNDCIEMVIQYNISRNLSGPRCHADHHIILTKDTGYFLKLTNSIGPTWFVVGSSTS